MSNQSLQYLSDNFDRSAHGISGLTNLGNTCFMNSGIQCLFQTPVLSEYYVTGKYSQHINRECKEIIVLKEWIRTILAYYEDNCIVSPISLKKSLGMFHKVYSSYRQNDSHELIIRLLDILHTSNSKMEFIPIKSKKDTLHENAAKVWNTFFKKQYSIVSHLFYGQSHDTSKCIECGYISHNFDPFVSVSLSTPNSSIKVALSSLWNEYTKDQQREKGNEIECDGCKKRVLTIGKNGFWKLPKYLIIHLKRFNNGMNKINTVVDYPIKDFQIYEEESNTNKTYDLYAISIHSGNILYGHYWCVAHNKDTDKWYNFNDQEVNVIMNPETKTRFAYVLFYQLRE